MEVGNLADVFGENTNLLGPASRLRRTDAFSGSKVAAFDLKHTKFGDGKRTSRIFPTPKEERDVEHLARHDRGVTRDFHGSIPKAIEVGKTAEEFVAIFSPLIPIHPPVGLRS